MSEVRTTSSTGAQKGVKPERYSLIPKAPLDLLATVYGFGVKKYAPHNYRKGYEWSKSYDALQRHLAAWWEREDNDPESGLSHLGHAAFHVFALIVFSSEKRYAQFDDRYMPTENALAETNPAVAAEVARDLEVSAAMGRTEDRADDDLKRCNIPGNSFWSSKGYTFQCRTHDRSITVPDNVTPHTCKDD